MAGIENQNAGSRADFLVLIKHFAEVNLDRLVREWARVDVDEKEARLLSNSILKALSIWDRALHGHPVALDKQSLKSEGPKVPPKKEEDQASGPGRKT